MTQQPIAQTGENRNPESPENRGKPALPSGNGYFRPAARPPDQRLAVRHGRLLLRQFGVEFLSIGFIVEARLAFYELRQDSKCFISMPNRVERGGEMVAHVGVLSHPLARLLEQTDRPSRLALLNQ